MSDDLPLLPSLADLHTRHYGLTEVVAAYYAEGATICMHRHHRPPKSIHVSEHGELGRDYVASWDAPSERQMAAWSNDLDATRDAAYGIVVAATEAHLGLFVTARAPVRSGSDYLLGPQPFYEDVNDPVDYEELEGSRLEVSGIARCGHVSNLTTRLREKAEQLRRGSSSLPGIAGVVAFDLALVRFQRV